MLNDSVAAMKSRHHRAGQTSTVVRPAKDGAILRAMRLSDYEAALELWQRCEGIGLGASDTRPAIAAYLRRNPGFSFVVTRNGVVFGTVLGGHDGRRGYLHHLAVDAPQRRAGLGRKLVERCLTKLRKAGIQKCNIFVFAGNKEGMKFWTRSGWGARPDLCLLQVDLTVSRERD
jgi:ribosomal protein S18 acetylase RimI-like enzyme